MHRMLTDATPTMNSTDGPELRHGHELPEGDHVRKLAESLDCLTEGDFVALARITWGTAAAWRKRGTGPAYALIGNRVLYPRKAVATHLEALMRTPRNGVPAGSLL